AFAPLLPARPGCLSANASADCLGSAACSAMEALSLRIDEMRRDDARLHLLVLQREGADDFLAHMLEAALEEAEGDVFVELDGPGDRGDITAAMALDLVARGEQDRAAPQLLAQFHAFNADQAPATRRLQGGTLAQRTPDIGLFLCRHLAEPEIVERIAMVELETGDMAFLDAQRRQGLEAIGLDAERRGGGQDSLPQRHAIIGAP